MRYPLTITNIAACATFGIIVGLLWALSQVTHPQPIECHGVTPAPIETCLPQPTHLVPQ